MPRLSRGVRAALLGGGARFSPLSLTIFAAMTPEPDDARKAIIDTLVKALVPTGVWDALDVLYIFAAHSEAAALVNWKDPGTFDATSVSGTAFTEDRGFLGDASADYIESNYNPSTAGGNWTQNSASLGFRSLTNNVNNQFMAGLHDTNESQILRFSTDNFYMVNGAGVQVSAADAGMDASFAVSRSTNDVTGYRNGASVGTANGAPSAVANHSLVFLTSETAQFSSNQVASGFGGGHLSGVQVAAYHAAELAYMQAVGAV